MFGTFLAGFSAANVVVMFSALIMWLLREYARLGPVESRFSSIRRDLGRLSMRDLAEGDFLVLSVGTSFSSASLGADH